MPRLSLVGVIGSVPLFFRRTMPSSAMVSVSSAAASVAFSCVSSDSVCTVPNVPDQNRVMTVP